MPIMEQELVILISWKGFPQLLESPLRSRLPSDIEVKQTSGSDFEGNKYIKNMEAYRHGNEEVAGDNPACVVLDERRPTLILAAMRSWRLPDIFSNRACESRIWSLSQSSSAIRSSPHVGFRLPFDESNAVHLPRSAVFRLVSTSNARTGGTQLDASRSRWLA